MVKSFGIGAPTSATNAARTRMAEAAPPIPTNITTHRVTSTRTTPVRSIQISGSPSFPDHRRGSLQVALEIADNPEDRELAYQRLVADVYAATITRSRDS